LHPYSQEFIGYVTVPACEIYKDFKPSIALLGPLNTTDAVTGELIFTDPSDANLALPFSVPDGYGVVVLDGSMMAERTVFNEESTGTKFLVPANTSDPGSAISEAISTPGLYYFVVWDDSSSDESDGDSNGGTESDNYDYEEDLGRAWPRDYGFVTGTEDNFQTCDWARLKAIAPFISQGRDLHQHCEELD
jgi:hypothetical protein